MAERDEQHGYGTRFAGFVEGTSEDEGIVVKHIYLLEPTICPEGHRHQDVGEVSVHVHDGDADATVFLSDTEALRLAFLLQRVVGWIADADGDTPDIEREAARWSQEEGADA